VLHQPSVVRPTECPRVRLRSAAVDGAADVDPTAERTLGLDIPGAIQS
jgi:hypothetical protein